MSRHYKQSKFNKRASKASGGWDSNPRPSGPKPDALARLRYHPYKNIRKIRFYSDANLLALRGARLPSFRRDTAAAKQKNRPVGEAVFRKRLRYFAAGAAGICAGAESTSITSTSKMSVELTGIPGTGWLP